MGMALKVLLVTTWGTACGIASHSAQLKQAVETADPQITIIPSVDALDPMHHEVRSLIHDAAVSGIDAVTLNYHLALHSRWQPDRVRELKDAGYPVVIIAHDTIGELPPTPLFRELCDLAHAFIVHEPCQGLEKAIYWRMGVPEYEGPELFPLYSRSRPVLGTLGFDFPWKNFDRLAELTASVGWGFCVVAPSLTPERTAELRSKNPWLTIHLNLPDNTVIAALRGCDATAFCFTCANSGQSASILYGLAAHKPVIAFSTCRQMRSLWELDRWGTQRIQWCETFEQVKDRLVYRPIQRLDPGIVALAEQESWARLGRKYAELYRSLVERRPTP
mgnify:CR=1 FL=1